MKAPIGKKHMEIAGKWFLSAGTFGTAGGLAVLYYTDWKTVLQFVPFYNGKFKTEE